MSCNDGGHRFCATPLRLNESSCDESGQNGGGFTPRQLIGPGCVFLEKSAAGTVPRVLKLVPLATRVHASCIWPRSFRPQRSPACEVLTRCEVRPRSGSPGTWRDQFTNLFVDRWPAWLAGPRFPAPTESQTPSTPSHDCLWLDDHQRQTPVGPKCRKQNPEHAVTPM